MLPIFYGHWCCPLLPRTDVPLNTVLGKALVLPRIEEPTKEDVARWHALPLPLPPTPTPYPYTPEPLHP